MLGPSSAMLSKMRNEISVSTAVTSSFEACVAIMNHDHDHEYSNGLPVNGEEIDEAQLDAYEQRLTNEAIIDQIKVIRQFLSLIQTFFAAQEVRVSLYHSFER
jgi:hypothetical protein